MESPHLEQLFRPCRVGRWTAKNRIFMSPMGRNRADDDHVPTGIMVEYYSSRASMGMLITESIMVQRGYSAMAYEPGIYSAEQVAGWRRVTDAVHAKGGLIAAQIYHGGRATVPCNVAGGAGAVVGASAVPISAAREACMAAWSRDGREQPFAQTVRALTTREIAAMVDTFARAARNCVAAGFDCVEVHAGTGFLIDQFLRTSSNTRTDEYGGSIENRCRFLLEVVDAVAAAVQADRVGVRLTPLDSTNGQSDAEPEALLRYVCDQLDQRRIAFVDLFRGDPAARAVARTELLVRENFGGAVLASHGYADAAAAEAAIAEGAVDAVCFGKAAIANPDLVWRILTGTPLNEADPTTFCTRGPVGYIDYPIRGPRNFMQPNVVDGDDDGATSAAAAGAADSAGVAYPLIIPAKDRPFFSVSQPLLIGTVTMKNRLVMGPIARQRCGEHQCATPAMVAYYVRRAGFGLQVSEPCEVQPGYCGYVRGAAVLNKAQVSAWRKVTDAVHQAGGLMYCQLHHGGRAVLPCNVTTASATRVCGPTACGIPADYVCPAVFAADGRAQPYAQDVEELRPATLEWIAKLFATSAKNALVAGFDGVEVHAGGGYLIDQFLRRCSNSRTDTYGGSVRSRCRLLNEVVDAVLAVVGKQRVGVRISPTDLSKGMSDEDAVEVAAAVGASMNARKVAYVVLASGSDGFFHGPVPSRVVEALRRSYTGVVMCDDNISMAEADLRVKQDHVQAVCMTLGAIANPDIIDRALHGVIIDEPDMHTLSTHAAEGYDTYTTYAEVRRQLREERVREWAENDAMYAAEGHDWLPEQRESVLRGARVATALSQENFALSPERVQSRGPSRTPFTSQPRDRRVSVTAFSAGMRRDSSTLNANIRNNNINSNSNYAMANTPNAAAAGKKKGDVGDEGDRGSRVPWTGSVSRRRERSAGNASASGFAQSPERQEGSSVFVRRDSRASRRHSIA